MDDFAFHSLAYVKASEDQRTAARIYTQFVRDGLSLFGESYRLESERLANEIWVHLDCEVPSVFRLPTGGFHATSFS